MPRGIRRRTKARTEWSTHHKTHLLTGHDFFGRGFGMRDFDEDAARAAWQELSGELLAEHIAAKPFSRPWAWWRFDSPEPRRQVIDDDAAGVTAFGPATWFGCPSMFSGPRPEAMYEDEKTYLTRLQLLTPHEVQLSK